MGPKDGTGARSGIVKTQNKNALGGEEGHLEEKQVTAPSSWSVVVLVMFFVQLKRGS